MAFFKFRWPGQKRQDGKSTKPSRAQRTENIDVMRRRARHRLMGAGVLVLLGVVGFPMLFDTQPRPIPVDTPIEIPDRNRVAPLVVPAGAPPAASVAPGPDARAPAAAGLAEGEEVLPSERSGQKTAAVPVPVAPAQLALRPEPKPEPKAEPKPEHKPEPKPAPKVEPKPEPKPAPKIEPKSPPEPKPEPKLPPEPKAKPEPPKAAPHNDEAARARALLEGRPMAPAAAPAQEGRFIVQIGAFADADKAREVRQKLERTGFKTYTQVVDTKDGKRTRVRVGPFQGRSEADKAAARIKALDLPASILTL